jgi:signal transduction histidine kinase/CheY-like chemotaxis protein
MAVEDHMAPYAFSQAFLSGFFAFAAISSLTLWARSRRDWTLLLLAAVCAIGSIQTVAVLVLATTDVISVSRNAQLVRGLCGLMIFPSLAWLYAEVARVRARPYLWFVTAVAVGVGVIAVLGLPLLGTVTGITRVLLPWGEPVFMAQRTHSSPLVPAIYLVMFSTVVFNVVCARVLMTRDRVSGVLLMVATLGSVVPLISGALVDVTSAPIPYIGTLGIAAFVLVIALQLAVGRRRNQELLAAERAQRTLEQRLAEAQKMEALGQLAGGIAHDFNNVLTLIAGHAELLLTRADVETRRGLDQIRLATERAASMTRQLLAFSRQSVLEPRVVNINSVVKQSETMLRSLGPIDIVVDVADDVRSVKADPDQLARVLLNIAINARDAMPNGGSVGIQTRNVVMDKTLVGANTRIPPGDYVLLAISDTGAGMTPETRSRLFEPFFTTKGQGKGTGLGLAVVDGVVRQSGGYIDVYSEIGHGTTFKIYLPAVESDGRRDERAESGEPARGSETILLVEDENALRELTQEILQRRGYTVLPACDATQALQIARDNAGRIDLVLTDVIMPGITGPQLVEQLRHEQPDLPALFMSGYTSDTVLRDDVATGEAHFLQKPFSAAVLAAKLRQVLDHA